MHRAHAASPNRADAAWQLVCHFVDNFMLDHENAAVIYCVAAVEYSFGRKFTMNMFLKIRTPAAIYKEHGFYGIISKLRSRYRLPLPRSAKARWKSGIESEIQFWDDYFRTGGLQWADSYGLRLDPDLSLQPRPAALLPPLQKDVHVLDVGAGPLTHLGKKCEGKVVSITAIDPLAHEYDRILDKYQIQPLVRTKCLAAEEIAKEFPSDTFDLVFARNCIDHAYHPETAIRNMIDVVKVGSFVLLEHRPNEAENENWKGLHQWNFSLSEKGDFLIRSKRKEINMTAKYAAICTITSEILSEDADGEWLITRIQKR
ncbi:MAG: class I SAM-dependent methyltransferase [Planctomycetaceae bacterium]